jgi:hypothetical protein
MEELLALLGDGHARTIELLAVQLNTDTDDVRRKIEYLERTGIIKKSFSPSCGAGKCAECALHSGSAPCKGCLPDGGFKNMGEMWEVVRKNEN